MQDNQAHKCVQYLKNHGGYHELLMGIFHRYRSLGRIGGSVCLDNLTDLQRDGLDGLLIPHNGDRAKIQVQQVEEALNKTKFAPVDLKAVMEIYFQEDLLSKKEEVADYEQARGCFYDQLLIKQDNSDFSQWIRQSIESKAPVYSWMNQLYKQDREGLAKLFAKGALVIEQLPEKEGNMEHKSIFAAKVLGDPHALDQPTQLYKLLCYYLKSRRNEEEIELLLYKAGLLKDQVVDRTPCYGFLALDNEGREIQTWSALYHDRLYMDISMWHLTHVGRLIAPKKKVYVVENPSVFSYLMIHYPEESFVCTMGQLTASNYQVLDLLTKEGDVLYYQGDYDPEGLLIAQRLLKRYGEKIRLWGYSEVLYQRYKADVPLAPKRLAQLAQIEDPQLEKIGQLINDYKKPAYQELMLENLEPIS